MTRVIVASLLLAIGCAPGAPGELAPEEYWPAILETQCQLNAECCADPSARWPSTSACLDTRARADVVDMLVAQSRDPRATWDGRVAAELVELARQGVERCGPPDVGAPTEPLLRGRVPLGGDCGGSVLAFVYDFCEPGLRCVTDTSGTRRCFGPASPGEACLGPEHCSEVTREYGCSTFGVCEPRPFTGEVCDASIACASGTYCASGICQPNLPAGASCCTDVGCPPCEGTCTLNRCETVTLRTLACDLGPT